MMHVRVAPARYSAAQLDQAVRQMTVCHVAETALGKCGDNGGLLTDGDSGGPVFSLAGTARAAR